MAERRLTRPPDERQVTVRFLTDDALAGRGSDRRASNLSGQKKLNESGQSRGPRRTKAVPAARPRRMSAVDGETDELSRTLSRIEIISRGGYVLDIQRSMRRVHVNPPRTGFTTTTISTIDRPQESVVPAPARRSHHGNFSRTSGSVPRPAAIVEAKSTQTTNRAAPQKRLIVT